jgi:stearoyl-CoA desaturase (delta-9 desaturase)
MDPVTPTPATRDRGVDWVSSIPFFGVHVAAVVGVVLLGFSWSGLALAVAFYVVRMFGVTGGYHRYFAHRTFKTSRAMQFLLAVLAVTSVQKGVLWWAAHHRAHHKYSDVDGDIHSAMRDGFWWSHVGWILSKKYDKTDEARVKDLARYPELRWLDRYWYVVVVSFAVVIFLVGGAWALVWGFFVSTTFLWHGTFTINSLSHMIGRRRYATADNSKNSALLAFITMGEGWHNNHHHYQRSTRQGFLWWQYDVTYYVLVAMSALGFVWDLHAPPAHVLDAPHARDVDVDVDTAQVDAGEAEAKMI